MSRYRGPRFKKIRRLGTLPGLSTQGEYNLCVEDDNRDLHPAKVDIRRRKKKTKPPWKQSLYYIRLQEKQRLSLHYGLTERQLLKYVRIAGKAKGETSRVLLQLLEMRLDNILFRLGMATTLPGARQLVTHRHILVNGRIVDIPSYRCKPQDTIEARDDQSRALIQKYLAARRKELEPLRLLKKKITRGMEQNQKRKKKKVPDDLKKKQVLERKQVPDHLTLRPSEYKGLVKKIIDPYPESVALYNPPPVGLEINALQVVEYYSRQI